MSIISISKIQHSYGLSENLPQLSAAELGWTIDNRKLYIGNGPTSEGAPVVGNTEILTEFSNILELSQSYTYRGDASGYSAQTGVNINSPVARTMQSKFDDTVSVRDFGATGDGVTDDTDSINRALYELFCRDTNPQVRRVLYFPAGNYLVSDEIKIPSYAFVRGEGLDCTFITQTDDTMTCVARTADSLQQVDVNIGNNGAILPVFIDISDITFAQTVEKEVFTINATTDLRCQRVGFKGSIETPIAQDLGTSCVTIYSTAINHSGNIVFEQCKFSNNNYGVVIDDDVNSVLFNACKIEDLYKGLKFGENTTGTDASVDGPVAVTVTNSYFNRIFSVGLHAYFVSYINSAYNFYDDVGNRLSGTAYDSCIIFEDDGCSSISDVFSRSAADDVLVRRVTTSGKKVFYQNPLTGYQNGRYQQLPAGQITLADNTASATSTGITFSATSEKAVKLYYTAGRGSNIRHGELTITASAAGVSYADEYQEDGADIGLVLTATVTSGVTTVKYTTTNTGNAVSFTYGIEKLNYL